MKEQLLKEISDAIIKFTSWLIIYGETSYDFESFYAGPIAHLPSLNLCNMLILIDKMPF